MSSTYCTDQGIQYSIHECPKKFVRDLKSIFPKIDPKETSIIPTCQRTFLDLTNWGDEVEDEKETLLKTFTNWANAFCERMVASGYWADYIDPCSGLPMLDKSCQQPYGEVEGFSVLLGYQTINAGCCKVLLHPEWGSHVYPATIFTSAPTEKILSTMMHLDAMKP